MFFVKLTENRLGMLLVLALALTLYLWNAVHVIDYAEYDESYYLVRGMLVTEHRYAEAAISDVSSAPGAVWLYAALYSWQHNANVYPYALIISVWVMGIAAYLLLGRLFSPLLSWLFALFIVVAATPVRPENMTYYLGVGILWTGLALLGRSVVLRGLAAFVVLISVYFRPEFQFCFWLLLIYLIYYEWRSIRRRRTKLLFTVAAYLPTLIGTLFTVTVIITYSTSTSVRLGNALPWSYVDYLQHTSPERVDGLNSYSNPTTLFQQDFGKLESTSVTGEVVALLRNPGKSVPYLGYNALRMFAAIGASFLEAWRWRLVPFPDESFAVTPNWLNIVGFGALCVVFAVAVLVRSRPIKLPELASIRKKPVYVGFLLLAALIPWLILINPHQRAFMILPLILLPVGYGLMILTANFKLPRWAGPLLVIVVLILLPHPFVGDIDRPVARSVDVLKQTLKSGDVLVGSPAETFANYLYADGITIVPMEAPQYLPAVLVNAYNKNSKLRYMVATHLYPDSTYKKWFDDWSQAHPDQTWQQVAALPDIRFAIFELKRP